MPSRLSSSCRVTDFVWHERMAGINGMRNRQAVLFLNDGNCPGHRKEFDTSPGNDESGPFKQPFIVQPDANPVVCLDSGRLQICRYEKVCRHEKSAGTKNPPVRKIRRYEIPGRAPFGTFDPVQGFEICPDSNAADCLL